MDNDITAPKPTEEPHQPDPKSTRSLADELQRESERLRALAEKLKAQEQAQAEMVASYPYLYRFVMDKLREEFAKTPELPSTDLEAVIRQEGGLQLEQFLPDLKKLAEGGS